MLIFSHEIFFWNAFDGATFAFHYFYMENIIRQILHEFFLKFCVWNSREKFHLISPEIQMKILLPMITNVDFSQVLPVVMTDFLKHYNSC